MKPLQISYAGRAPKVIATRVVALYDAETGRIHHSHTVHIHKGGRDVAEQEAIEAAHLHSRRLGHDTVQLRLNISTNAGHGHRNLASNLTSGDFSATSTHMA